MDKVILEGALNELVRQFGEAGSPPQDKLAALARRAQTGHKKLQTDMDKLQDLLDYLRICIKYQAFDLEATRRENTYLRRLLDESNR